MYHLELRAFPHAARAFNLDREALDARFLKPHAAGDTIEYEDRRWPADRTRLTVVEGPELGPADRGLGRGWALAVKQGRDVTERVLAEIARGGDSRSDVERVKDVLAARVAVSPLSFADVIALAVAAQPAWRASEQLALAEQAVWELLHQGRLEMVDEEQGVLVRERWQPILLRWPTWAGARSSAIRLRAPA